MTKSKTTRLELRRIFAAPRDEVFAAFTDPQALMQWWCPPGHAAASVQADVRINGRYRIAMRSHTSEVVTYVSGIYREIIPPTKLVFTHVFEAPTQGPAVNSSERSSLLNLQTLVSVEFIARDSTRGSTEVILTQENLPNGEACEQLLGGWDTMLQMLAQFLHKQATGHPPR